MSQFLTRVFGARPLGAFAMPGIQHRSIPFQGKSRGDFGHLWRDWSSGAGRHMLPLDMYLFWSLHVTSSIKLVVLPLQIRPEFMESEHTRRRSLRRAGSLERKGLEVRSSLAPALAAALRTPRITSGGRLARAVVTTSMAGRLLVKKQRTKQRRRRFRRFPSF